MRAGGRVDGEITRRGGCDSEEESDEVREKRRERVSIAAQRGVRDGTRRRGAVFGG